jgi:hypothetical protein
MAVLPRRFSDLIREKTKFSEEAAQKRVIYLNKLPVGEIEHQLADYYDKEAKVNITYIGILRHIRDLVKDEIPLDDPAARKRIESEELRLKVISQEMDEVREKVKVFSEELEEKVHAIIQLRLAEVTKCDDGLFILHFRRIDPSSPVGLEYQDSVQIFVDTTPGENGALVFVHEMLQPKWMPSV